MCSVSDVIYGKTSVEGCISFLSLLTLSSIILMSATADAEKFSRYFAQAMGGGDGMMNPLQLCPCVTVPGRTFPVSSYFLEDAIETTGYVLDEDSEFAVRRHNTRGKKN